MFCWQPVPPLFPPHHLVHNARVALYDFHHFGADILVHVVGHGDARMTVSDELHGNVNALQQTLGIDAAEHEAALVKGFWSFRARADAYSREGMAYRSKERAFLRQGAAVTHHREGIHLQTVVVMEAKRFMLIPRGLTENSIYGSAPSVTIQC